jgi:hypothetical protein
LKPSLKYNGSVPEIESLGDAGQVIMNIPS